MRSRLTTLLVATALLTACAGNPDRRTLAELHGQKPDVSDVRVENGLDQAMLGYRKFLEEAPESSLTPEAMRRLADLKLEKEFGILGDGSTAALPAPAAAKALGQSASEGKATGPAAPSESQRAFEQRAAAAQTLAATGTGAAVELPNAPIAGAVQAESQGPLEAIELYDQILASYPGYRHNDRVLYQKARAFDELGRTDDGIAVVEELIAQYPGSRYIDEVQFRRGEYFFTRKRFLEAEEAYSAITSIGAGSDYYELALYKLGWSLYKQELHEEALHQYIALLDYKVETGYDFDQTQNEVDERRIADTYRVVSLSFSSLGGSDAVTNYFAANGRRGYEDRVYAQLGEFYFEKLRYNDAATAYRAFVELNPLHRSAPHFGMRVVEIYEAGGFPKLVLESKKEFAASYGLQSEYWQHFAVAETPEVLSYLKSNLKDLATHYHSRYQVKDLAEDQAANFDEALQWYRAYLASFPSDVESPEINHQLADLLLEHEDFAVAALEYERTAYDYPQHGRAPAAGYAAIYAHRKAQSAAEGDAHEVARAQAVTSTLRFVDVFPTHEHAAVVLGAAVDDLYETKAFEQAIANGRKLIDAYPQADSAILRAAWAAIAHSSFDLENFPQAEQAYGEVLARTPEDDNAHQSVVDNLAAAIYKQGEQARTAEDYAGAADHFLRITKAAPTSAIRPAAEYDAGAALIVLKEWTRAASVLDAFRQSYPEHELNREATKQIASVYREQGALAQAADEYVRAADEAEEPELRREALLLAAGLYEDSDADEKALEVYRRYVREFPKPLELALETRFKIAEIHREAGDTAEHRAEHRKIVELDGKAGAERTARTRYLAARSAVVLAEEYYQRFGEIKLVQPFEKNLEKKQRRMEIALEVFENLLDYEVAEATAAATFYMAELYSDFSQALIGSERPAELAGAELLDYELVLEEEAYPFEEKAIEVHEKNLELMTAGVYNRWIDKSFMKLAELMPGRYAKFEQSSGPIAELDRYAYRVPTLPVPEGVVGSEEGGAAAEIADAASAPSAPTEETAGAAAEPTAAPAESGEASEVAQSESGPPDPAVEPALAADAAAVGELATGASTPESAESSSEIGGPVSESATVEPTRVATEAAGQAAEADEAVQPAADAAAIETAEAAGAEAPSESPAAQTVAETAERAEAPQPAEDQAPSPASEAEPTPAVPAAPSPTAEATAEAGTEAE